MKTLLAGLLAVSALTGAIPASAADYSHRHGGYDHQAYRHNHHGRSNYNWRANYGHHHYYGHHHQYYGNHHGYRGDRH
ncbi:MAG: hypothetical protein ABI376_06990 [Caulobacteraceae bacterium]